MTVGHGPRESVTIDDEVLPKIAADGWSEDQVTREFLVKAKDITTPSGATRHHPDGSVDIVLSTHPGTPTVAVEAKRSHRTAEAAIQQAIRYAEQLDVPLAYGTNGGRIIERNLRTGVETEVDNFTDPVEAWANYCLQHGLDDAGAALLAEAPSRAKRAVSGAVVEPRYYQTVAINRVLRAIARGGRRVLLLMATGTGKTFTAMQIVHKLREHAREARPDRNYRVLYLADRDQLLTQPMKKDFIPAFGTQTVARVRGSADPSREIFFASYQALTGDRVDTGAGALA
ncbi:MAG: DEAD/DEAH box helicase family protein, partial [Promicromonosporaceae bacterium]|nr:DEAD/DEAH box helicase family protein [Promicromonosporaceae bacterium]